MSVPCEAGQKGAVNRRGFLKTFVFALAGALSGDWWMRRHGHAREHVEPFTVPESEDLAPGTARELAVPGTAIAGLLVRLGSGEYVAYDRRCPHLGCPVLWSAERARLECPCHRAAFDARSGAVLSGPPERGLTRLAVEQVDGRLWVRSAEQTTA